MSEVALIFDIHCAHFIANQDGILNNKTTIQIGIVMRMLMALTYIAISVKSVMRLFPLLPTQKYVLIVHEYIL